MPAGFPPGPAPMPPMMFPPPPPPMPPRRGGSAKWVILVILFLALAISIIVNFIQFGISLVSAAADVRQTVLTTGGSDKVAVVPIDGLIDDSSADKFDTVLKEVEKDASVKSLVVAVNTPGGSATASDEMYHRLVLFKTDRKIPVIIAMRGMATSGGYYVSAAGDFIFAEPGCLTGNIGVLFPRFNLSQTINKWGAYETTLTATTTGHSYKNAGSMFQPSDPRDEVYLQGLVDGTFAQFKQVVMTGRKGKLSDNHGDIFSGKAFIAGDALSRGLIDRIGYPDAAYDYAAKTAGLTSWSVVRFEKNPGLLDLFSARSNVPTGQASSTSGGVTINGISIDAKTAADFFTARPLLLWRGN
jgi:protease-4